MSYRWVTEYSGGFSASILRESGDADAGGGRLLARPTTRCSNSRDGACAGVKGEADEYIPMDW